MRRSKFVNALAGMALILGSVACLGVAGCGNGDPDPNGSGPANTVDVTITGAGGSDSIKGESESAVPQQFTAAVANGELVVYLLGADGTVVFFTIDMAKTPLPDKVTPGQDLGDAAFLTVTRSTGVLTSNGTGTISIAQCPDAAGKVISGSFSGVGLNNLMGGTDKLDGAFKVGIVVHDNSHKCSGKTAPDGGSGSDGGVAKYPPGCTAQECKGSCCPYGPCMTSCSLSCMQTKCGGMDFMGCIACLTACWDECNVSADCRSCLQKLDDCATKYDCDPGPPEDSPCIGQHCCDEYKACF